MNRSRAVAPEQQPTVLLIEDDENTLFAMDKLLTRAGYLVLTAGSGHDAIGMLEHPLSPIDVVLLDVRLPDVDGPALGARMRELKPAVPILVCSGEAEPEEVDALVRLGTVRYFQKPVGAEQLLTAVESALTLGPELPINAGASTDSRRIEARRVPAGTARPWQRQRSITFPFRTHILTKYDNGLDGCLYSSR
jgi:DNA-binding NtrC family response regulator